MNWHIVTRGVEWRDSSSGFSVTYKIDSPWGAGFRLVKKQGMTYEFHGVYGTLAEAKTAAREMA